ncbi:hypothetical protein ACHAWT_007919 [Skeletonema menzelii]|eukprot:scaffold7298_cov150-Skeletonema_menzelii.AAC.9
MRSAVRKLCQQGVEALRPQKVNEKWRKPAISRRVAGDLRKAAIRAGTYGKFDAETGAGWDPAWDAPERRHPLLDDASAVGDVASNEALDSILLGSNKGAIQSIRPPKETKRERTRETRAQKIESLLKDADNKIEEYRLEKEASKPKPGIEEEFKRAMKGSRY